MELDGICALTKETPQNDEQAKMIDDATFFLTLYAIKNPDEIMHNNYLKGIMRGLSFGGFVEIPFDGEPILTGKGEYKFKVLENKMGTL